MKVEPPFLPTLPATGSRNQPPGQPGVSSIAQPGHLPPQLAPRLPAHSSACPLLSQPIARPRNSGKPEQGASSLIIESSGPQQRCLECSGGIWDCCNDWGVEGGTPAKDATDSGLCRNCPASLTSPACPAVYFCRAVLLKLERAGRENRSLGSTPECPTHQVCRGRRTCVSHGSLVPG